MANGGNGTVSVISDVTNTVIATIPVGFDPVGIAFDSSKDEAFVANHLMKTVSVISYETSTATATTSTASISTSTMTVSTSSSASSAGGSGIPEFPVQLGFTLLATVIIVTSYVLAGRVRLPRIGRGDPN